MEFILIFLTGLTTGVFMCIPMCGGIMTSCIACAQRNISEKDTRLPLYLYLGSKITSYTLVGALLGYLGSFFQVSNEFRAYVAIFAAVFMVLLGIQMLDIHPLFRRFNISAPGFLLKIVKKESKDEGYFAPIFLGFLTAFLPCGPMQAAQILALSSGNAFRGALIMFVFGLGTSPALFGLGYFVSKFGERYKDKFIKASAFFVLILALVILNRGLVLAGSKYSFSSLRNIALSRLGPSNFGIATKNQNVQEVTLKVFSGYDPRIIKVKEGIPVRLMIERYDSSFCTRDIVIKEYGIYKVLPDGKKNNPSKTVIEFTPPKKGTFTFSCGMGMLTGSIIVE